MKCTAAAPYSRRSSRTKPAGTIGPFDLVFLDPPYGQGLGERALASLAEGDWLAPEATIVLEDSRDAAIALPAGFVLDDRREYGAAAVHFIGRGQ